MPVGRRLDPDVFEPEQVAMLARVFDEVLEALGLIGQANTVTRLIAEKVLKLARAGEHDPERLKQLTLRAFPLRPGQRPS
jgi:hypothetical protein